MSSNEDGVRGTEVATEVPALDHVRSKSDLMQRVPWAEASPVNDPDGVRKLTCDQPSSDTVIDRTAAFDSRQNDDESMLKSSCTRQ